MSDFIPSPHTHYTGRLSGHEFVRAAVDSHELYDVSPMYKSYF